MINYEMPYLLLTSIALTSAVIVPSLALIKHLRKNMNKTNADLQLSEFEVVRKKRILRAVSAGFVLISAVFLLYGYLLVHTNLLA